jgi:hypothetical protein
MGDFSRLSVFLIIVYLVFLNLIAGCVFTNTENPRSSQSKNPHGNSGTSAPVTNPVVPLFL